MKRFYKLINPSGLWCMLCLILSSSAMFVIVTNHLNHTFYAYIVYALATYTLVIISWKLIKQWMSMQQQLYSHKWSRLFLCDPVYRTKCLMCCTFVINLLYALIKLYLGIYYSSAWFIVLAHYYMILALMRFILLVQFQKQAARTHVVKELHTVHLCGILLFFLTVVLAIAAAFMIRQNQSLHYPGSLIYAAAYAFYNVGSSLYNWFKYRKQNSLLLFAAKNSSLASALVSMLAMQTALLTRFSSDEAY